MWATRYWEGVGLKRFLIVKTSSLGDIVHSFPVVSYLKAKFPDCLIDWIVEKPFAELVEAHPDINQIYKVETKKWRRSPLSSLTLREFRHYRQQIRSADYDLILDLQGNLKSGFLGFQAKGNIRLGFGRKTVPELPNLLFTNSRIDPPPGKNIREDYLCLIKTHMGDDAPFEFQGVRLRSSFKSDKYLSSGKNVMVCPGAHWANKQLPVNTLIEFLKNFNDCSILVIWGSEKERDIATQIQREVSSSCVIPRLPLPDLQNLMSDVDLVIAMDSLPLHLAGTTTTPTYSFFGPTQAEKYRPPGTNHRSYQGACPYGEMFEKRCPKLKTCPTGACLRELYPSNPSD